MIGSVMTDRHTLLYIELGEPGKGWRAFLLRLMTCDVKAHPSGSHNQSPYCQRTSFVLSDSAIIRGYLFVKTVHPKFF
jgi:hypothetical protein